MSVDRIMGLGDDSLNTNWVLLFPNGIPGGADSDTISLRIESDFSLPDVTVATYNVEYRGIKIPKTTQSDGTDKKLSDLTVRIDSKWKVFDDLWRLFKMTYNPNDGTAMPDATTRFPIVIQMLDGQHKLVKTFTFNYCKITDLKLGDLTHGEGKAVTATMSLIYGTFDIS